MTLYAKGILAFISFGSVKYIDPIWAMTSDLIRLFLRPSIIPSG